MNCPRCGHSLSITNTLTNYQEPFDWVENLALHCAAPCDAFYFIAKGTGPVWLESLVSSLRGNPTSLQIAYFHANEPVPQHN